MYIDYRLDMERGEPVPYVSAERGRFYLLQLAPAAQPLLVKMGYTMTPDEKRLAQYRRKWPAFRVVKMWNVFGWWEKSAIAAVTLGRCVQAAEGNERFLADDIDALVARLDAFFAAWPATSPDYRLRDLPYRDNPALRAWATLLFDPHRSWKRTAADLMKPD